MFVKEKAAGEVKELSKPAKMFLKAAEIMERQGLCQNTLQDAEGRICTANSIGMATTTGSPYSFEAMALFRIFSDVVGREVCNWNNEPGRTAAQSAAMLRHIATKV